MTADAESPQSTPAPSDVASAICAEHEAAALGACGRCGSYFCADCTGEAPNDVLCKRCDEIVGYVGWEHERAKVGALRAWTRTFAVLMRSPREAARRIPIAGSLGAPIAYAAIAWGLHVVIYALTVGSIRWFFWSQSLERFGARDAVGRIIAVSDFPHAVLMVTLLSPATAVAAAFALSGAVRIVGAELSPRAAVRVIAYGSSYLVWHGVPFVAIVAFIAAPLFVYRSLEARTGLRPFRRGLAVALTGGAVACAWFVGAAIYYATLGPLVSELTGHILERL